MKEVSCRAINTCFAELQRRGLPSSFITSGLPYTESYLQTLSNRINWVDYCHIITNFNKVIGGAKALEEFGYRQVLRSEGLSWFNSIAGFCTGPRLVVWFAHKAAIHILFNMLTTEFEDLPDGKIRFTIRIDDGYQSCPEFFLVCKGIYRAIPRVINMPDNEIEMVAHDREADLIITPPARRKRIWGRLWQKSEDFPKMNVEGIKTIFEEFNYQQDQLKTSYHDLQTNYMALLKAEAHLKEANEGLERRVSERTQEVEAKANDLSRALSEKRTLLAIMSHDISNPLMVISARLRQAIQGYEDDDRREDSLEALKKALDSASKIEDIINFVRRLEATEFGKAIMELKPVPLLETIRSSISMFESQISAKKLQVVIAPTMEREFYVRADPLTLGSSVINNLLSNAVKFSEPETSIKINVERNSPYVHLSVSDQGIGIPVEYILKIFRFDKPTTRPGTHGEEGTGLGMPLVKTFMHLYGGNIYVESKTKEENAVEHGTTFHLEFQECGSGN